MKTLLEKKIKKEKREIQKNSNTQHNNNKMVISGLQPLEFTDCLLDSPEFRENLYRHEKELEKTNQQIKRIVKEVKDLLGAAKGESGIFHYSGFLGIVEISLPIFASLLKVLVGCGKKKNYEKKKKRTYNYYFINFYRDSNPGILHNPRLFII